MYPNKMLAKNSPEIEIVQKMTGLDANSIYSIQYGKSMAGVDVVLVIQIISLVIKYLPMIIDWFNERGWFTKIRMIWLAKKLTVKEGKTHISSIELANSTYDVLKER